MNQLDEHSREILRKLQKNCKLAVAEIASAIESPPSTVYAKVKRMEAEGLIKAYKTVLDAKQLGRGTTAFILAAFAYRPPGVEKPLSQREIAAKVAEFPEVQEVHIITGDWDMLIKVKAKDVEAVGQFVIDKIRAVKGIDKTLTCMVFESVKETTDINI
ncbi:MAG: Lrp/AsnC family transcriptional regulator [Candidatus Heimdallarchaeota archaeon]